jgi:hypothetical protein
MKFSVTFKDPDCVVNDVPEAEYVDLLPPKARALTDQFFDYSEYVTIEFDTEKQTAKVQRI